MPEMKLQDLKTKSAVELLAFDRKLDAVVVAVHVLALALISAQGVSGGEGFFHGNFEHGCTSIIVRARASAAVPSEWA